MEQDNKGLGNATEACNEIDLKCSSEQITKLEKETEFVSNEQQTRTCEEKDEKICVRDDLENDDQYMAMVNHINSDISKEAVKPNVEVPTNSVKTMDTGPPNGSLEKMSLIDKEANQPKRKNEHNKDALDSDDDTEPPADEEKNGYKYNDADLVAAKHSESLGKMLVQEDEDSGGGGTTSYETAGSSTASQSGKPVTLNETHAAEGGSKCESSLSFGASFSRGCRGRKRTNLRSRQSSSSSSRNSLVSSTSSSSSSLDSDDDSKSSNSSSSSIVFSESWRDKKLTHKRKNKNKSLENERKKSSNDTEKDEEVNANKIIQVNANGGDEKTCNENSDIGKGHAGASASVTPSLKKKKKKRKKRQKLEKGKNEKRKKRSSSISSRSSDAFVSLEDIPGSSELQAPAQSSNMESSHAEETGSRRNADQRAENLSNNSASEDDGMRNSETRHRSDSTSGSSSSSSDAIYRQARFGPRNRMMRARIRAQEGPREDESDNDRPPPEVLNKPPAKCKYSFFRDFVKRQYDSRPTYPWFINNRIGSLDLVKRFQLSHKLEGHEGCVNALHFNESGSRLASGSDDKEIIVWDWEVGKKCVSFPSGHHSNVFQSKFLPLTGDTHLVSTSRDGQVRLAVLSTTGVCRSTRRLAQHKGPANKLALLPQSPHTLVSCGEDGVLYSVDVREPKPTKLLVQKDPDPISGGGNGANSINTMRKTIPVYTVNANPLNDNLIVTAGRDPHIRMYDRRFASEENNQPIKKYCPHHLMNSDTRASITCAVWNYNGTEVLASYNDDDIYLFDASHSDGADFIKRYQGHRNSATVKGVNFYGAKSEFIVSGSDCGNIFFWDKSTEGIVHMMSGDVHGVVNVLEPHPNLPVLATSGLDDEVKIWLPNANEETTREEVEKAVMKNAKDRRNNSLLEPDWFDGQMLWVMLRHLRADRRQRERAAARDGGDANPREDTDSVSEDEDNQGDDDVDSDDEDRGGMPTCQQS